LSNESRITEPIFIQPALKDIYPSGWYIDQLLVQKNGLTGHIEEIWDDLGSNSGWLGGTGESWERGPYYLDGLVPLAYLLRDETLQEKARKWIEWILSSQTDDGFFGPFNNNDWWPRIVVLKAVMQYHSATGDDRIPFFMDRFFRHHLRNLKNRPFEMWGTPRGPEELLPIFYLYNFTKEQYLLELAKDVLDHSYDWDCIFNKFPYVETTHEYLNKHLFILVKKLTIFINELKNKRKTRPAKVKTKEQIKKDNDSKNLHIFHETHSVNIAMAFKMPVLEYLLTGKPDNLKTARNGIAAVMKYHGLVNHVFSGDEHLNGHSPTVGAELCLVAEYMHSLETLLTVTGSSEYADMLEQVAYNAWPATFLQDMNAHQYVQQVNQIEVSKKKRGWYDAFSESNLFGLEPNYGCCTANMHQGWPKLSGSILMKHGDGIATGIYAPVRVRIGNMEISETTDYPFDGIVKLHIDKIDDSHEPGEIPLWLRIPEWCREFSVYINDEAYACTVDNGYVKINRRFNEGDYIRLEMELKLYISYTGRGSVSIHYGSLLMALPIEGKFKKIRGDEPFADWEIFPDTEWRYAVVANQVADAEITKQKPGDRPFGDENPAVLASLNMVPAPQWRCERGNAGKLPEAFSVSKAKLINKKLVPYGCTRLRIAEFPIAGITEDNNGNKKKIQAART
jgi:hypothetical protein